MRRTLLIKVVHKTGSFGNEGQPLGLTDELDWLSVVDYRPAIDPFHGRHEALPAEMSRHAHCSTDRPCFKDWSNPKEDSDPLSIITLDQIHVACVLNVGMIVVVDDGIYTFWWGIKRTHR